LKWNNLNLRE